jgi:DNA-binding response OmpR family regulator
MVDPKRSKILLVSGDTLLEDSLKLYLESKGCEVYLASNSEEALDLLNRFLFDLIISVHGRSSVDAFALSDRIKKLKLASSPYKVIVCDSCDNQTQYNNRKPLADICITKPLTGEVVDRMLQLLSISRDRANQKRDPI